MKILWVCNVILPRIYKIKGEENKNHVGGWLEGMSDSLLNQKEVELIYCYPIFDKDNVLEIKKDNFFSYGIPMKYKEAVKTLDETSDSVRIFEKILKKENPDIIHFWGTEFLYSLEFYKVAKNFKKNKKCIVSIQGLVGMYAKHYYAGLPNNLIYKFTLSELKGKCSLNKIKKSFEFRGEKEEELLKEIEYVIGRTSWDKACTKLINPNVIYYKCNESLRNIFYDGEWKYENCRPYQIFISQASYPIKGFHKVIEAIGYIKKEYPEILIKVAGQNIFTGNRIKGNTYGNYIKNLIKENKLEKNIEFLGMINAERMKKELLASNLFICPSSIENSPNSLGEAMLLGLPCIASNVGGCADMLENGKEGYLYPFDETYKLAYYIKKIFDNISLAKKLGIEAKKKANITHNREENNKILYNIYKSIM